jgi:ankyrin repeat protein
MISKEVIRFFLENKDTKNFFHAIPLTMNYNDYRAMVNNIHSLINDKNNTIAQGARTLLVDVCDKCYELDAQMRTNDEIMGIINIFNIYPKRERYSNKDDYNEAIETHYQHCQAAIDSLCIAGKLNDYFDFPCHPHETVLMLAARGTHCRLVKMLLKAGSFLHLTNAEKNNALVIALKSDMDNQLTWSPDAGDKNSYWRKSRYELVKMLIDESAGVIQHNWDKGAHALATAIKFNHNDDMIKLLLDTGASTRELGIFILAYREKVNLHIFKLLCEKILVTQTDKNKALFFLIENICEDELKLHNDGNSRDCIQKLNNNIIGYIKTMLDVGANVNAVDANGNTPLYSYIERGAVCNDTIKMFIKYGAKTNFQNAKGNNYLHLMSRELFFYSDKDEYFLDLLTHNPDCVNVKNKRNETLLHTYLANPVNYTRSDKLFLKNIYVMLGFGLDINAQDIDGMTPLMLAVSKFRVPHKDIIRLLLDNGANINAVNKKGDTALILACKLYNYQYESEDKDKLASLEALHAVIDMLVRSKANKKIVNNDGFSALGIAALGGHIPIIESLIRDRSRLF